MGLRNLPPLPDEPVAREVLEDFLQRAEEGYGDVKDIDSYREVTGGSMLPLAIGALVTHRVLGVDQSGQLALLGERYRYTTLFMGTHDQQYAVGDVGLAHIRPFGESRILRFADYDAEQANAVAGKISNVSSVKSYHLKSDKSPETLQQVVRISGALVDTLLKVTSSDKR